MSDQSSRIYLDLLSDQIAELTQAVGELSLELRSSTGSYQVVSSQPASVAPAASVASGASTTGTNHLFTTLPEQTLECPLLFGSHFSFEERARVWSVVGGRDLCWGGRSTRRP